jgi:PleD family two-component response regulator/EAL domain-containing protein (putative c-di-GMP-specific phosphodiesterase class I)
MHVSAMGNQADCIEVQEMLTPIKRGVANNHVYYLGDDTALCLDLGSLLNQKGLTLRIFAAPDALAAATAQTAPVVLILEMGKIPTGTTIEPFLNGLLANAAQRPELLCIAVQEAIETRLQAMRAGAQGVYLAPVSAGDLAQRVIQLSGIGDTGRYRVLVVEDDPAQAKYVALLLSNANIESRVVGEPLKVLDAIRSFRPDLVLMDLYMPDANGDELTAIIRDQDEFLDLPIIFLSAELDLDRQMDALRVGGDSFLAKPIQRKLLIDSIEHRIRMARWLRERRLAVSRRDAAAGLLQTDQFMRHLDRCVRSSGTPGEVGLLLIEIDSPQETLDRLGFDGTDRLSRRLEIELSNRMTPEECATRLGDFSYALLAKRDDARALVDLAERLRDLLADSGSTGHTGAPAEAAEHQTTVSIGIGRFAPAADDALTMLSRGQKAAMAARAAGGNRVQFWEPAVTPGQPAQADAQIRTLLEGAIARQGLMLLFQPILSLGQDAGELYEVQLRLRAPDGEHIPPHDFLPVAERTGLMPAIDRWVMQHAMDVMDVQRVAHPRLRLLVPQTLTAVAAPQWLQWFRDQIVQRNLIRLRPLLVLRMGEILRDLNTAKPLMANLRQYGVQVCITDCSGSPAERQILAEVAVALVKLSTHTLTNSEQGVLAGIVRDLRDLGSAVIAAGIEDPETIARVWNSRPDFLQGNYLQLPSAELSYDFAKAEYLA